LAVWSPCRAVTSDGRSRQYVTRNSATAELYALDSSGEHATGTCAPGGPRHAAGSVSSA
jgi:hypothetical protein